MGEPTQSQWKPFDWSKEGKVWMANFRSLQARIKDRFRVAVDRERHRQWLAHRRYTCSSYSSVVKRWVSRFYARPSSHLSIRSRCRVPVSEDVNGISESVILRMLRAVAVPVIGNACHIFMHGFNNVRVFGAEKLHGALLHRSEGKPLLTVSNHVASIDDPFVIASLLPPSVLLDARNLRWTLCATDRCFKNPLLSTFFHCGKVLPVSRGDGVYQKGMDMALSKLNKGGWVHIFPEGTRSRDGKTLGPSKRGVGRLVMDADDIPLVLPFVHSGMQEVMPIGSSFPKVGKQVTILVGDPILFDDLLLSLDESQNSRSVLYDAVSNRIGDRLYALKAKLDKLVIEQSLELDDEYSVTNADRANVILHQLDWEAFGMENYMLPEEENPTFALDPPPRSTIPLDRLDDSNSTVPHTRMNLPNGGGIVSRIRGFIDPTELMGFAAKGLLLDARKQIRSSFEEATPLNMWKLYLEENIFGRWYSF